MFTLDIRTLTLIATLIAALTAIAMYVLWRPSRDPSLKIWMIGAGSLALGLLLLGLRGAVPDLLSVVLANALITFCAGCIWLSIDAFFSRRQQWQVIFAATAATVALFSYFTIVDPNIVARIILISAISALFPLLAVLRLAKESVPPQVRSARTFMMVALFCHSLYSIARIVLTLVDTPGADFMTSGIVQASSMVDAIITVFVQTFGLTALVQGRNQWQLNEAKLAADRSNAAKSQFIASMSHEIRTPLNAIIGYGQLFLSANLQPTEKMRATRLLAAGRSLLRLIDDILDFSKFQSGDVSIYNRNVDIRSAIQTQIEFIRPESEERNLTVDVLINPDVPRFVNFDGERFQQVLLNLLTNAVKFTLQGKVTLRCGVATDNAEHAGRAVLMLTVSDTGIGMTREQMARIFHPFERMNEINAPGTGLGLTIVQTIVSAMSGTLDLQSEKGRGTTVTLRFPVNTVPKSEIAVLPAPVPAARSSKAVTILVAEDDARNAEIIEAFLNMAGVSTVLVRDGKAAIAFAASRRFSAILMDIEMPVVNGLDAARGIRALEGSYYADVPIIALTAYAAQEDRERCFAAGMTHFITKPIDRDELMRVLMSCDVLHVQPGTENAERSVENQFDHHSPPVFDRDHIAALSAALPAERLSAFLQESIAASEKQLKVISTPELDRQSRSAAFHHLVSIYGNVALMRLSAKSRLFQDQLLRGHEIAPEDYAAFRNDVAEGCAMLQSFLDGMRS